MRIAIAAIAVLAAAPAALLDDPPALRDLLAHAGQYVRGFQQDFATVISDETYLQREMLSERVNGKMRDSRLQRSMRSEMLFLALPQERDWLSVRNVLAVDGKPIPDSRARLDRALATAEPGTMGRLRSLRDEGARFNIGRLQRNLSDPTLALKFLDPGYQSRFRFTLAGAESVSGIQAWKLAFAETDQTPTMISMDGRGVPSTGAIWMTPSGIVLRTRIELVDAERFVRISMVVSYGRDAKLGGWVPAHMEEEYDHHFDDASAAALLKRATGNGRIAGQKVVIVDAVRETISCAATYSNYRRFETSGRIVPPQ